MKLSTKGRYAVMAMVDLACQNKDMPVALADIGLRQDISVSYLEQLFGKLRKGAQVKSVRGPGGGYLLARGADQIKISDITLLVLQLKTNAVLAKKFMESLFLVPSRI